jgi:predicted metal-dependent phosphoesterase TrpH
MFADLHLHSTYSDGTDTPDELIRLSIDNGIKVISITDHDTVSGYNNITDMRTPDISVIPAIEISTVLGHSYLHILGYYIDARSDKLAKYIRRVSEEKTENTRINFESALSLGVFDYKWERVLELHRNHPRISGVHVVDSMQKDNYVIDGLGLWDFFHKYFWAESPDFIPTETATAYDAIDIIKKAGGVPIIAHPKSIGNDMIIESLIQYGAQGLEVFHPTHKEEESIKYRQMAEDKKVFITGGTDWHGKNNGSEINRFGMCGLQNSDYPILHWRNN